MDIFSVITLMGGLAFFLYGMTVLSGGLERMAGGRLERSLKKMTSNRFKCLALGAGITAAIQSSSAVTVMLVGLVNSGIMSIGQSIGVIMGSNIGTTMTAWILTLVGIESGNVFISLLKPENFSLVFAFLGVILIMASKSEKKRDVGVILVGFAVLMYGMKLMSAAVKPLAEEPAFTKLFTAFENPLLGVLVGLAVTAVIQSSSASVGILQALALTGAVSYGAAIPIIMGQNIGTCITAVISGIGVSRNARKVAVVHVSFNLIGTAVCLTAYCIAKALLKPALISQPIDAVGIAVIHSSFNIITTALLLPFTGALEKLANRILPDGEAGDAEHTLLDKRLLVTPSVAISECDELTVRMCTLAEETLLTAISLFDNYKESLREAVQKNENRLDRYEDELGTYLVQLSAEKLSLEDSLRVSKMLHVIGDFERLGDHAVNLCEAADELYSKGLRFSEAARRELAVLTSAIREILAVTGLAYRNGELAHAERTEPLEQTIDGLVEEIKSRHINRLQKGECSIELGFILADVLGDLERVSDHCSNIAVAVIELSRSSFDTHSYLSGIRSDDLTFKARYDEFCGKYRLPENNA
ncbi:MAG: Na/Pi cotransporter family protein [Oscillospiraceae bacterium]|nr:Na/Pi cotransporter family protein [Oscillospiraceae bacterium]